MILSVSRRTDIPAFYSEWFRNRVKEGFAYVRNPMNIRQIHKVLINPDVVDCIVFWTKNPHAMLSRLNEIDDFNYYFQFTLNPYNRSIEKFVPEKESIIDTFKKLSDKIGGNRVVWRYDPILFTDNIGADYHIKYFDFTAKQLNSYTNKCIISFIDNYKKTERNMKRLSVRESNEAEILSVAEAVVDIAKTYHIEVQTCAEKYDLENIGIKHGKCIDNLMTENIAGYEIDTKKDKNQRKECGCTESVDIGEYNTCKHNCLYCYANFNHYEVEKKTKTHNPTSPLLTGEFTENNQVIDRKCFSFKSRKLF